VGFDNGIVLSSGDIVNVLGPNTSDSISANNGQPGDANLSALTGRVTNDAAVLEFDFVPDAATIFFQYVFASDEYNEFVNSQFDDVFAFFVNNANCANVNGERVSVNTINNGNPFGTNPRSNPGLYRNNDLNDGGVLDTEMDGLTVVLTCKAAVIPNSVNHMKLAIADSSDNILDSNVFIQATSLTTAIHDFKQYSDPWAIRPLYELKDCSTMAQVGCAITAVTDVVRSYGLQTLKDGAAVDPGTVNHYLGTVPQTHSGCFIYWGNAAQSLGYTAHVYLARTKDKGGKPIVAVPLDQRIQRINSALAVGYLPIINVDGHYVVLYESAGQAPDGSPDYRIVDPGYSTHSGKRLSETFKSVNALESVLDVIVIDNTAPHSGTAWSIVAHSPVALLVTDPSGARTGTDPSTGAYVQEIEDSWYGVEQGLVDDTGVDPPLPDLLTFGQNGLSSGTYIVQVIGVGSGPYSLDFAVGSGLTPIQTVTGTATLGKIDTFELQANSDGTIVVSSTTVADAGGPYSVKEGSPLQLDGTNSTGSDGESLTYEWDSDYDGTTFDVDPSLTGPTPTVTYSDNGNKTVALRVTDSHNISSEIATAEITVENVAPTVNAGDDKAITAGETLSANGNFADPGDDTWSATVDYGDGSGIRPLDLVDKTFKVSHVYEKAGKYTLTVCVVDDDGGAHCDDVAIAVTEANSAPVATDDEAMTDEGAPVIVDVLANDSDADGDSLTIDSFDETSAEGGTVTDNGDGKLTYAPPAGFVGTDSFGYAIADGRGGTDTATVKVTVNAANLPPVANDDAVTTAQDVPVVINVLTNDSDPDGDALSISELGVPTHGAVAKNGDGTVTYTPESGFVGIDTFSYSVEDGRGGIASAMVTVTVTQTKVTPQGPGYWKTHPANTAALLPESLGNFVVGTSADATAVFKNMSCGSNKAKSAVNCLAAQLLAAKLNIALGSDACIAQSIEQADALLREIGYAGPSGSYKLTADQRERAIGLKNLLDQYNSGLGCG
jgi:hypothetical protein